MMKLLSSGKCYLNLSISVIVMFSRATSKHKIHKGGILQIKLPENSLQNGSINGLCCHSGLCPSSFTLKLVEEKSNSHQARVEII